MNFTCDVSTTSNITPNKSNSKRLKWKSDEDIYLLQYAKESSWRSIGAALGRTDDACRNRWMRLTKTPYKEGKRQSIKRQHWCKEEDEILNSCYTMYGPKWSLIAQHIPNRDAHSVRNRFTRNKFVPGHCENFPTTR